MTPRDPDVIDPTTLRFAVLGCGAVGSAFAHALADVGVEPVLWSRNPERAQRLGNELQAPARVAVDLEAAVGGVQVALLTVTDSAVAPFAARIADLGAISTSPPPTALHCAGYFGPEVLAPLAEAGWSTGLVHPLVAMPPDGAARGALAGAWCAVAGDETARTIAEWIVETVGGHGLVLRDGAGVSRSYHAAAALLAGGAVALVNAAEDVLASCLEDPARARPALLALLETALRPLAELGPSGALAGPTARGSVEVVQGHLEALRALDPRVASLYARLGERMAALAAGRGSIDADRRGDLEDLFRGE